MIKKFFSLLVCVLITLTALLPTFAAEGDFTITVNDETKQVGLTLATRMYAGSNAEVMVWMPNESYSADADLNAELAYIGQTQVGADQTVSFSFELRDNAPSGRYTAEVLVQGEGLKTKTFDFQNLDKAAHVLAVAQSGNAKEIQKIFNGTDEGSLQDIHVESYQTYADYSDPKKEYVATKIAAAPPADNEALKTQVIAVLNSLSVTETFAAADRPTQKEMLTTYHEMFGFEGYETYQTLSEVEEEKFFTALGPLAEDCDFPEEIATALAGALTAAGKTTTPSKPSTPTRGGGGGGGGGGSTTKMPNMKLNDSLLTVTETKNESAAPFADLAEAQWATVPITVLYDMGYVSGKGDGLFCPNDVITREEAVQMLVKAFNLKAVSLKELPFTDVSKDAWYYETVRIAEQRGVVGGISATEFGAGQNVTRQDLAVMLNKALAATGRKLEKLEDAPEAFADFDTIAGYAQESVTLLQMAEILNGRDNNCFAPNGTATRAEVAKMIYAVLYRFNML